MKFFAVTCLAVVIFAGYASAEVTGHFMMFDNDYTEVDESSEGDFTSYLQGGVLRLCFTGVDVNKIDIRYYDSLATMLLALEKGDIDYLNIPRFVARYLLENNDALTVKGFSWWPIQQGADTLNFAFLENNAELVKKFNNALADMKKDGTLAIIEKTYADNYGLTEQPAVSFENFADAESITVALTGDLPPVDYVDASGEPEGFNVAVLAEIGRCLHVNIRTIQVESGARLAALTSGRADVIFWFHGNMARKDNKLLFIEKPKGILVSEPYYAYNEFYFIGKR